MARRVSRKGKTPRVRVRSASDVEADDLERLARLDRRLASRLLLANESRRAGRIADVLELEPNVEFAFGLGDVGEAEAADRLNGGLGGYDNSPFVSVNPRLEPLSADVALVQCFFGTDELQARAAKVGALLMSLSSPRPSEWVFVEAQRSEADARFKWTAALGAEYVFVRIRNDRQDYFVKEQLWNIGAAKAKSGRLVFADADVAYCQTDWLRRVSGTFDEGCELFQPHAWSWRAGEPDGFKGEDRRINDLNLTESFAHVRKTGDLRPFNGHTGYDVAVTRAYYNAIRGFYAFVGTGADFLQWSLFVSDDQEFMNGNSFKNFILKILKNSPVPKTKIGCSDLVCFHNYHGSTAGRERGYEKDVEKIMRSETPELFVANNYGSASISEMGCIQ